MPDGRNVAYLYDGSFEGLMTAVFEAYENHEEPARIADADTFQSAFGEESVEIQTNYEKAERVCVSVEKKIGERDFASLYSCFLSENPHRGTMIYRYIRLGLKMGYETCTRLTHPDVLPVCKISRAVGGEYQKLRGFIRFSMMEGHVYYAEISPKYNQTPLLMPHFADRLQKNPFVIHDVRRKTAGLYNTESWEIVSAENLTPPSFSQDELEYRQLWKTFYKTIAIEERKNARLQMQMMPKRYWKHMIEMGL